MGQRIGSKKWYCKMEVIKKDRQKLSCNGTPLNFWYGCLGCDKKHFPSRSDDIE